MPANLTTAVGRVPTHSIFAIALLISLAVPVWSQDYDKGLEAFQAGDFDTALNEWRQLAEQGHARAQYELGNMYEYGRGVGQNDADAVKWYTKSASQGVALAQYKLGVLYENGWGVLKNETEAVKWYRNAAEQGYPFAQHDLAFMYAAGKGVAQDYVRAYMWLDIAVAQGSNLMAKHLKRIAKHLTPAQIAQAQDLARVWLNQQQR